MWDLFFLCPSLDPKHVGLPPAVHHIVRSGWAVSTWCLYLLHCTAWNFTLLAMVHAFHSCRVVWYPLVTPSPQLRRESRQHSQSWGRRRMLWVSNQRSERRSRSLYGEGREERRKCMEGRGGGGGSGDGGLEGRGQDKQHLHMKLLTKLQTLRSLLLTS